MTPLSGRESACNLQRPCPAWKLETDMTDLINFEALECIGLSAAMHAQLACGVADPAARPMRLVEVQRNHLLLHDGLETRRGQASPGLMHDLQRQDEALVVGDWVLARPQDGAGGWLVVCRLLPQHQITRRLARRNSLRDLNSPADSPRQALVSNVDTALLVMGLDADFNLRRLERYLALVQLAGVAAVLVLSKADTMLPAQQAQRLAQARAVLPPGMAALALDLRCAAAAEHLAPWLQRGQTLVLLGSSGAGKTTLANTLGSAVSARLPPLPGTLLRPDCAASASGPGQTGPVRTADSRGRHTTTVRSLRPLPGGACLIDTPGLRALRLDLADAHSLAEAFGDVARWATLCRFRDCQHRLEPGCVVREQLPQARLRNFHKLLRESGRDGLSLAERQAESARWKARSRDAELRLRAKREAGG